MQNHQAPSKNSFEFIALMALLMSMVAFSIDTMLPALSDMGKELSIVHENDIQLIVSSVFLGMSFGLIFYGPLSDAFGRKKIFYIGIIIFIIGSFMAMMTHDFTLMLIARGLQGFGGASSRVLTGAMVRDQYKGEEMGKIMSLIMMIFIMVPVLAPSIGQLILSYGSWRSIFALFILNALIALFWLAFRQEETLAPEKRIPFSLKKILSAAAETCSNKRARGFTLAASLVFGSLIGYLSSAQQIFQVQYNVGDLFPIYFGALAFGVGISSFINSRVVMTYGMERLCLLSLKVLTTSSILFTILTYFSEGHPNFFILLAYLSLSFFCLGILFGNLSSMALEPLGHIAGIANSIISSTQTLLSVLIGGLIGRLYDGTVWPLAIGFLTCYILALFVVKKTTSQYKN
ncbi:MAG: multidrug effflux MFS transporter [Halobacteriovoraceae bacterium]|nr:multidrug effflux MFS transporter [Halobacteriovoraceae bacterium]